MKPSDLNATFQKLFTPLIADAVVRLDLEPRMAPPGIAPLLPGTRLAGRVRPVRHYGSVDIFLEAMAAAEEGDVLVIDNGGRRDEGCIGDLTALEARAQGIAGLVVWGAHRDTIPLSEIDFPIFSYGTCPFGPVRVDPREPGALTSARFGSLEVIADDAVFADDDGVLFVPLSLVTEILEVAAEIHATERRQASDIAGGVTLYEQLKVAEYAERRASDPERTFRQHLREIGGAIEE